MKNIEYQKPTEEDIKVVLQYLQDSIEKKQTDVEEYKNNPVQPEPTERMK